MSTTAPSEMGDKAQEKVKEGTEAAKEQAQGAARQAQTMAREQLDQRTTQAGEQLSGHAGDARSIAQSLRNEGKDGPARLVEQAADRAENLGSYLTEADADRLVGDIEDFARRNPWAVIAGGLFLGFAASRMVSASSESRTVQRAPARGSLPSGASGPASPPSREPGPHAAAETPRASADAAIGEPYADAGDARPANADLPHYGGAPA